MTEKYISELPVSITVSDKEGKIIYMNKKSAKVFEKYGGDKLIGKNIFDYHNPVSQQKINKMLSNNSTNAYTIEKNGIKKMIFQSPWKENGETKGMIEFSFEIPFEMQHFIRS
ncbi:MAG: diguanylate cyclase [Bacteroidetes bacterium CG02_land_8_20_14_3_00_31_25]|nr:PAS domain-containing protein [Bacteroidota bacterium]PIV59450.1 MAG: diguanylate cyclase [Bacteroidetes bacterium CG02_land_8_20_14_3_00_31_25]PIX33766.1 MAG: diguanylate cyclase [Bacteroidetes bacterium CG_4_8_14_3_um_filter_31_14]PIY02967.1 MAG: diguanylate cyclase [Bacteroidetes bacterium CG_4_10_14_3_um_filter_31_20]